MTTIWSDKKLVDKTINILLFLVAVNFLHYGQLILPVICLILFIDNKFNFKVNNIVTFVILCLFAISFCAFSYKLGFYCVMGFCLPMAYYIGSNIKNVNEENIKKIIYIIAFGMAFHVVLNFIYDLFYYGVNYGVLPFSRHSHYDFWLGYEIAPAGTVMNYVLITGCIYYILFYENNRIIKIIGLLLYLIIMVYNFALGRRTPVAMLVILIILSIMFDKMKQRKKQNILLFLIVGFFVILIIMIARFNINVPFLSNTIIVEKIKYDGIRSGRLEIFIEALEYLPKYLFGGQHISSLINNQIHNLWFDIYDYAGIIPFVLFLKYSIDSGIKYAYYVKANYRKTSTLLYFGIFICIILEALIEPVMTGASLFLICSIIIVTSVEKLSN